jgi:hypothetical protein
MSMLRPGQPFRAFGKHDEYVDLNIFNVLRHVSFLGKVLSSYSWNFLCCSSITALIMQAFDIGVVWCH